MYDSGVHADIYNKHLHVEVIPVIEHATSDYRWAKYASKKHAAIGIADVCRNIANRSLMH